MRNPNRLTLGFASALLLVLLFSLLSSTEEVAVPPLLPLIPSLLVASLLYLTWTNGRVLAYVKRRKPLTCLLVA
ncbi:MAG: hypothetical protein ACETVR_03020, partial [Candidatus Bathyarchaeia archaeon]